MKIKILILLLHFYFANAVSQEIYYDTGLQEKDGSFDTITGTTFSINSLAWIPSKKIPVIFIGIGYSYNVLKDSDIEIKSISFYPSVAFNLIGTGIDLSIQPYLNLHNNYRFERLRTKLNVKLMIFNVSVFNDTYINGNKKNIIGMSFGIGYPLPIMVITPYGLNVFGFPIGKYEEDSVSEQK